MPPEAVDLVSRLLQYSPNLRYSAVCIPAFFLLYLNAIDKGYNYFETEMQKVLVINSWNFVTPGVFCKHICV
jgi:hypothetical protein